jgi:hypothetical protein
LKATHLSNLQIKLFVTFLPNLSRIKCFKEWVSLTKPQTTSFCSSFRSWSRTASLPTSTQRSPSTRTPSSSAAPSTSTLTRDAPQSALAVQYHSNTRVLCQARSPFFKHGPWKHSKMPLFCSKTSFYVKFIVKFTKIKWS